MHAYIRPFDRANKRKPYPSVADVLKVSIIRRTWTNGVYCTTYHGDVNYRRAKRLAARWIKHPTGIIDVLARALYVRCNYYTGKYEAYGVGRVHAEPELLAYGIKRGFIRDTGRVDYYGDRILFPTAKGAKFIGHKYPSCGEPENAGL